MNYKRRADRISHISDGFNALSVSPPKSTLSIAFTSATKPLDSKPQTTLSKVLGAQAASIKPTPVKLQTFNTSNPATLPTPATIQLERNKANGAMENAKTTRGKLQGLHQEIKKDIMGALEKTGAEKGFSKMAVNAAFTPSTETTGASLATDIFDPTGGALSTGKAAHESGVSIYSEIAMTPDQKNEVLNGAHAFLNSDEYDGDFDFSGVEPKELEGLLQDLTHDNCPELKDIDAEIAKAEAALDNYGAAEYKHNQYNPPKVDLFDIEISCDGLKSIYGNVSGMHAQPETGSLQKLFNEPVPLYKQSFKPVAGFGARA